MLHLLLRLSEHLFKSVHVGQEQVSVLFHRRTRTEEVHHIEGYRPPGNVVPPDDRTPIRRQLFQKSVTDPVVRLVGLNPRRIYGLAL